MGRVSRAVAIVVVAIGFCFLGADLSQESQDIFYTVMDACELYWNLRMDEGRAEEAMQVFMNQYGEHSDHFCWILLEGDEVGRTLGMTRWEMWMANTSLWRRMMVMVLSAVLVMGMPVWYVYRAESMHT